MVEPGFVQDARRYLAVLHKRRAIVSLVVCRALQLHDAAALPGERPDPHRALLAQGPAHQAVESVLSRSYQDLELIVVDDGSTDETADLLRGLDPRLRYFRQANQGVAVARNHGIAQSRGRYVALVDDDTWFRDKLQRQLEALGRAPSYRGCLTAYMLTDEELHPWRAVQREQTTVSLEDLLLQGNIMGSVSSMLCERTLLEAAGAFDPLLSQCADWDLWIRMLQFGDLFYLREPLVSYRWHRSNMSFKVAVLESDTLRVLEKAFAIPAFPARLQARRRAAFAHHYTVLAGCYFHAGEYASFSRCFFQAMLLEVPDYSSDFFNYAREQEGLPSYSDRDYRIEFDRDYLLECLDRGGWRLAFFEARNGCLLAVGDAVP